MDITLEESEEEDQDHSGKGRWQELRVDPENVLPPMTAKWTDYELLMTLDSFTCRIQNALQSIVKRFMTGRINAPNVLAKLEDAGMTKETLNVVGELLGYV